MVKSGGQERTREEYKLSLSTSWKAVMDHRVQAGVITQAGLAAPTCPSCGPAPSAPMSSRGPCL